MCPLSFLKNKNKYFTELEFLDFTYEVSLKLGFIYDHIEQILKFIRENI